MKKLKAVLSWLLNFMCAFAVAAILFTAAGAFFAADEGIKSRAGHASTNIFAYDMKTDTTATLTAFGQKVTIDYAAIAQVGKKMEQLGSINEIFTPEIVHMAGDAVADIFAITARPLLSFLIDAYDKYSVW